jgi:GNAT superfamily N-acetyltransferase
MTHIRRATLADLQEIRALQTNSLRALAEAYYDPPTVEAMISAGLMDEALITDGTYFVAMRSGVIVGTGGWSTRSPAYETMIVDDDRDDTAMLATVRSIFVHPQAARSGVASFLMSHIEAEIARAGHARAGLAATLSGLPFYLRLGWQTGKATALALPGGLSFPLVRMTKSLVGVLGSSDRAA